MEVDPFTLIGTGLCAIGLLIEHFHFQGLLRERIAMLEEACKDLSTLKKDTSEIKTKMELFWGALEQQIPGMLLKGNPIAEDSRLFYLLSRFHANRISDAEVCELVELLDNEVKKPDHTAGETISMVMFSASQKAKLHVSSGGECLDRLNHSD